VSARELRFFVPGKPVSKARPRVIARGVRCTAYTPAKTRAWEAAIRLVGASSARRSGWAATSEPCEVEIALRGLHPLSDVDNAAKAVLDALNGLAWDDDRRVWSLHVRRDETLAADGALVIVRRVDGQGVRT
jgi:crossover junction endodeoxyribonuclease RusA